MSALGDFLRLLHLNCSVYHNQQSCGDWLVTEHAPGQTCFHLVTHGECRLEVGDRARTVSAGDVILFPRESPHRLVPVEASTGPARRYPLAGGWREDSTGLLCAAIRFEHRAGEKLLDHWPSYLVISPDTRASERIMPILAQLVAVSREGGAGCEVVVDRLAEIIFMQVVRHDIEQASRPVGFLAAYLHPALERALEAFHREPQRAWTLAEAAATAHMSRARFARSFKEVTGWTWGEYLTWWRMQLAWKALESGEPVIQVAALVGYRSEAAFSRAFHGHFGAYAGDVKRGRAS